MAEFGTPETWNMKVGDFIETELPKEKPQALLDLQEQNRKQRLLQSLQKIGPRLEDSSLDFIRRQNFSNGLGANISEYKSKGKQLGYNVRSRKEGIEKTFSKYQYDGSLEKALEAAKKYREETLGNYITNEQYLELRNQHKEKSAKEFAEYLKKETNFKPRRGEKFTREGVKTRDREVNFETTRVKTKRTLAPEIEEEVYQKYLKAVKEGKREGTIIGLGREYLPGLTRSQQEKTISRILKEKGVDLSPFKKEGTGEKAATQVARRKRLSTAKKQAGSSAGQLSDEIILDIKAMNNKVKNMSLEDIAANKKYINSMRINATMDNLSKGVIPFDKYKDLTDLELAEKIKDRADDNKFFDVEHISSVKGQKRNLYYPNNIQMAPGQFGSLMDNFKRIADEQPNNPVLSKVDEVLSEYNLTVRNPETKVRLGNKSVIEVSEGTSNIVKSNFDALNTPFEKQTITKAAQPRKKFKPGMQPDGRLVDLPDGNKKGMNLAFAEALGTAAEKGKIYGPKYAKQIVNMARPAAKLTGLELLLGSAFAPLDIGEGRPMKDVALNVATLGMGVPVKDAKRASAFADKYGLKEDLFTAKMKLAGANKIRGDQEIELTNNEEKALQAETYFKENILQPELDELRTIRQSESDPNFGLTAFDLDKGDLQ